MAEFSQEEIKKLKEFLEAKGKKILLYHQDCDGVCSAALFLKFFAGFEAYSRKGPIIEDRFANEIVKKKPSLVVSLDLPLDQGWKKVGKTMGKIPGCRWVIIDHHVITKNLNGKEFVHINPRFREKSAYIPVSCLLYDILKGIRKDAEPYVWIAAVGSVGDYAPHCSAVAECKKIYPELLEPRNTLTHTEYASVNNVIDSKIKAGAELISSIISAKESAGSEMILEILAKSETFESFENKKQLKKIKAEVDDEVSRLISSFEGAKKEHGDINMVEYGINTRFGLTAVIASALSERFPEKIVFVYKKTKGGWKISLRCQSGKVNLDRIVRKCLGEKDSGGGHERAAGGVVYDIKKFREKLTEELRKLK